VLSCASLTAYPLTADARYTVHLQPPLSSHTGSVKSVRSCHTLLQQFAPTLWHPGRLDLKRWTRLRVPYLQKAWDAHMLGLGFLFRFVLCLVFVCVCMSLPLGPCMSHEALSGHTCNISSFQHRRVGSACAHSKKRPKELPMDNLTGIHATATQRPRTPCSDTIQHDRTYKRFERTQTATPDHAGSSHGNDAAMQVRLAGRRPLC
jgi:hypothetical protein